HYGGGPALHHRQRRLRERGQAVAAHVVRDAEALAGDRFVEVAGERLARSERDRMHHAVEAIPALPQRGEDRVDLRVVGDVAGQQDVAREFGEQLRDALAHGLALVGKGEFRAFAMHRARNAVGDRTGAEQPRDEDLLSGEESGPWGPAHASIRALRSASWLRMRTWRPSMAIHSCASKNESVRLTVSKVSPR